MIQSQNRCQSHKYDSKLTPDSESARTAQEPPEQEDGASANGVMLTFDQDFDPTDSRRYELLVGWSELNSRNWYW